MAMQALMAALRNRILIDYLFPYEDIVVHYGLQKVVGLARSKLICWWGFMSHQRVRSGWMISP